MQIDWWTLGLQTINFLVVVWLLSRFLYRPVRRIIEEREAADRKLSDEAEAKKKDAEKARLDYERKLDDLAETERQKEAELHKAMEAEREKILQEARQKAKSLLSEARQRAETERQDAMQNLKADITGLALDLARKALSKGASPDAALEAAKAHLDGLSKEDIAELRKDIEPGGPPVIVVTETNLGTELQADWKAALTERLGSGISVDFAADPELLGGVELRFPHAVLNLSVARRLEDAAEALVD